MMPRSELIKLILWTMRYYGSDARERNQPGSKVQAQAEHIADVIAQYNEATVRCNDLDLVKIEIKVR